MTVLSILIVLATALIAIVVVAVVLARQGHPEEGAGHSARLDDPEDGKMLRAPGSRPGGPGQESQNVVDPGDIAPGAPDTR